MSDSSAKGILGGRYRLDAELGSGGFGDVFAGWDVELDRPVAIKRLRTTRADSAEAIRRFRRETRAAGRLRSPHAVPVHDVGRTADGQLYMVMERVQGPTLQAVLAQGPLPADDALRICEQTCALLVEAHGAGLVHRDLKPANLMLDRVDGHQQRVRVLDFGVAKMMDGTGETTRGIVGTPAYVAPEVWAEESVDGRTDLYAVGLMLHEMLAGAPAVAASTFHGAARVHLFDGIPRLDERTPPVAASPDLQALIDALTARSPEERPPDAEAARRRIVDCIGQATSSPAAREHVPARPMPSSIPATTIDGDSLDGAPLPIPEPTAHPPPDRRDRRRIGWLGVVLILVSGLLLALARGPSETDALDAARDTESNPPLPIGDVGLDSGPTAEAEAISAAPIGGDARVDSAPAADAAPIETPTRRPDPPAGPTRPRPPEAPTIRIDTRPDGARVWQGDRLIGTAPIDMPIEVETTVVIEADGHYSKRVRLTPGTTPVRVILDPEVRLRRDDAR